MGLRAHASRVGLSQPPQPPAPPPAAPATAPANATAPATAPSGRLPRWQAFVLNSPDTPLEMFGFTMRRREKLVALLPFTILIVTLTGIINSLM